MNFKRFKLILGVAVMLVICAAVKPLSAKADEVSLVGLSGDLIRLFMTPSDQLEVIDEAFVEIGDGEDNKTEVLTFNGVTSLVSQFVFPVCSSGSYVNVRKGPSTKSDVVGRIYSGSVATAVGSEGDWTKIVSGKIEGYVYSPYFKFGQEALDKATEYYKDHYRVVSTTLKLRSEPNTNATVKAVLPEFSELIRVKDSTEKSGWIKVKWVAAASTVTGYVSTDYVSNKYSYAVTVEKAQNFQTANTKLIQNILWPYPGEYNIYSDYGMRLHPILKVYKMHSGLDIGGRKGDTLVAGLSGTVTLAEYSGSGKTVIINNGNGVQLWYCHCSKFLVKNGQTVSQGEAIAQVGSTGLATSPHLHFEIHINGKTVDPLPYLEARYKVKFPRGNRNKR